MQIQHNQITHVEANQLRTYDDYTSRAARGGGGSFKNRKPIGKIRCCESRNVFVGGNSKTATAVKNLDAITEREAHDYCFANCFRTCQEGPFSVDFTVCSNLGI